MWRLIPLLTVLLVTACDDDTGDPGNGGARDAGQPTCRLNSDCPPGLFCKEQVCDFDCRGARDCAPSEVCESGQCIVDVPRPGPDMRPSADMSLDATPIDAAPDAARVDARVDAGPRTCRETGCPQGLMCNDATGGCEPGDPEPEPGPATEPEPDAGARQPLGGACERPFHCTSDTCFSEPNNADRGFCTQVCCSETDCPDGFGCLYYQGARLCFPSRLFPTNNFSEPAGGRCGNGVNDCRTGLCADNRCLGSCCTDRDCLGSACVWLPTDGGSVRAVCDRPNLLGGPVGSLCNSEFDCANRICVLNPNAQPNGPAGICVDTCCTHQDCGGGFGCGQLLGRGGNIISTCLPMPRGALADSAACGRSEDCASGHCVEGQCRQPCCRDQDRNGACLPTQRCLPRDNGEGTLIRVCVEPTPPE